MFCFLMKTIQSYQQLYKCLLYRTCGTFWCYKLNCIIGNDNWSSGPKILTYFEHYNLYSLMLALLYIAQKWFWIKENYDESFWWT